MRAALVILTLLAVMNMAHPSAVAAKQGAGIVVGRVTENSGCPVKSVPGANIMIPGTKLGCLADCHGRFRLENIPVGDVRIRVMAVTYPPQETVVHVVPGDSVRADFALRSEWSAYIPDKPVTDAELCRVHGTRMRWVLMPVSYGLRVMDPKQRFVSAWCADEGGCVLEPGRLKVSWGQSCPVCADSLAIGKSRGRWKSATVSRTSTVSNGWSHYVSLGLVQFDAPAGLLSSAPDDTCGLTRHWVGDKVNVVIDYAYFWADLPEGDFDVMDVISDCAAKISVKTSYNEARISAFVAATPTSIEDRRVSVIAYGPDAEKTARMILSSVRFPDHK